MYNPYLLDLHRLHRQELTDEISRDRAARTDARTALGAPWARRAARALAGHRIDSTGRQSCSPAFLS